MKMIKILILLLMFVNTAYGAETFPVNEQCQLPDRDEAGGLVALWHMNADVNPIIDSSGNGHTGEDYGTPVNAAAKFGNGETLDGNEYFVVTDHDDFHVTEFTITAWIKVTDSGDAQFIMSQTGTSPNQAFWLAFGPDDYDWYIHVKGSNGKYIARADLSNVNVWDNKWHFVCGTWDGGVTTASLELYADGVAISDTNDSNGNIDTMNNATVNVRIGGVELWATNRGVNGLIDDVAFYSRCMSVEEILTIYHRQVIIH